MRTESTPTLERPEPSEVFRLLAHAVEEHLHEQGADEASIREIVAEELGKVMLPKTLEVKLPDGIAAANPMRSGAGIETRSAG